MSRPRVWVLVGVVAALLLVAFFEAPLVAYTVPLTIPNDIRPEGYRTCFNLYLNITRTTTTQALNLTEQSRLFQDCLNGYLYPPYLATGRSTLAYDLFGIGAPPFPKWVVFSQGNYTAIVTFSGKAATAAYEFWIPGKNLTVQPEGVVQVVNASVQRTGYGNLVFSATAKNIGDSTLSPVGIGVFGVSLPQYTGFGTVYNGLTWYFSGVGDNCAALLAPGKTCTTLSLLGNDSFASSDIHFIVGVVGVDHGNVFFYTQAFDQPAPQPGLSQDWVRLFMERVNQDRQGAALVENSTLDKFAALRFKTASSQPQISDYGFQSDAAAFFGSQGAASSISELLLYPGRATPYLYVTELQTSGPGHWSALMNPAYTQFGYYIGEAPYYDISANCPVTEVPSAGVNIMQYFEGYGCTVTPVAEVPWLVIVLS